MKTILRTWPIIAIAAGTLMALSGCVATVDGYGRPVDVYGGYYDPYGRDYNGWGPRYYVAPPRRDRDDHDRPVRAESPPRQPAYRPAPAAQPVPSIPVRPREQRKDKDSGKRKN